LTVLSDIRRGPLDASDVVPLLRIEEVRSSNLLCSTHQNDPVAL
jgi:hypothetical protein